MAMVIEAVEAKVLLDSKSTGSLIKSMGQSNVQSNIYSLKRNIKHHLTYSYEQQSSSSPIVLKETLYKHVADEGSGSYTC